MLFKQTKCLALLMHWARDCLQTLTFTGSFDQWGLCSRQGWQVRNGWPWEFECAYLGCCMCFVKLESIKSAYDKPKIELARLLLYAFLAATVINP